MIPGGSSVQRFCIIHTRNSPSSIPIRRVLTLRYMGARLTCSFYKACRNKLKYYLPRHVRSLRLSILLESWRAKTTSVLHPSYRTNRPVIFRIGECQVESAWEVTVQSESTIPFSLFRRVSAVTRGVHGITS